MSRFAPTDPTDGVVFFTLTATLPIEVDSSFLIEHMRSHVSLRLASPGIAIALFWLALVEKIRVVRGSDQSRQRRSLLRFSYIHNWNLIMVFDCSGFVLRPKRQHGIYFKFNFLYMHTYIHTYIHAYIHT